MSQAVGDLGLTINISSPILLSEIIGSNLVVNHSFEIAGTGAFATWVEDTDSGNAIITQSSTVAQAGTYSCRIESVVGGESVGNVTQTIAVEAGATYHLHFWTRTNHGYASEQGRFAVYDEDNSQWIISRENVGAFSGTSWGLVTRIFNVPRNCASITIYLYQNIDATDPIGGDSYVYYDNVTLFKRKGTASAPIENWGMIGGISGYSHTISATLGFDNMQLSGAGDELYLSDWMENGLLRHVEVKDVLNRKIWEGFVNEVTVATGGLTVTVGPIMDVVNRGRLVFKEMNWGVNPAQGGETVRTNWEDNESGQQQYGILEGVITGGEGDVAEMLQVLSSVVPYTSWPDTSQNFSLTGTGGMQLTVSCLGYGRLLEKYFYYYTGEAGEQDISEKLEWILDADPNHIFSSYNSDIITNSTQIHKYEGDDKTAMASIKEAVALGDASYNRYTWGVYENLTFKYGPVGDSPTYFQSLGSGKIIDVSGADVYPWEVKPAVWMMITDFMAGSPIEYSNFRRDPRYIFIESVTFSAPYALTVSGGRASKFKNRIERLGLGGV